MQPPRFLAHQFAALASLIGLLWLASGVALAHHGWSMYGDEDFQLTGVVEAIDLGNPHGELQVRVEGELWSVVLGPPRRNQRAGIEEGVIAVGDTVTAHGYRHVDRDRLEMKTERLEANGTAYQIY